MGGELVNKLVGSHDQGQLVYDLRAMLGFLKVFDIDHLEHQNMASIQPTTGTPKSTPFLWIKK